MLDREWTIVIPVKGSADAKSRFGGDPVERLALAEAMALDTVETAAMVAPVVVIGGQGLSHEFGDSARVMIEQPGDGLNGAIRRALETVEGNAAVLLADLPALTADELRSALVAGAFVPDSEGTGTSLITGREPAFGQGSAERHRALGYRQLSLPPTSGLRLDVDSPEALAAIPLERLGPRTRALLLTR